MYNPSIALPVLSNLRFMLSKCVLLCVLFDAQVNISSESRTLFMLGQERYYSVPHLEIPEGKCEIIVDEKHEKLGEPSPIVGLLSKTSGEQEEAISVKSEDGRGVRRAALPNVTPHDLNLYPCLPFNPLSIREAWPCPLQRLEE